MPEGWNHTTLGELLTLEYGKSLPDRERDGVGHPVFGSNGVVGLHSAPLVAGPGIVVGRKGTAGSVSWASQDFFPIDTTYWVKLRDERVLDMQFAALLLEFADLPAVCAQTGVPGLNRDRAYEILVQLPSRPEQRRIVDLVNALSTQIRVVREEQSKARNLLRLTRADLIAEGHVTRGGDAFNILMGRQRSPGRAIGPSMTPYLRAANIKDGSLDLTDVKEMDFSAEERAQFAVVPGDVLVSEGSGSADAVGASARWLGELAGPLCFQNTLLRYRAREGVSRVGFVYHWCRWAYESGAFRSVANGTNILHIGSNRSIEMPVRVPTLARQEEIAGSLDALELLECALAREADALAALRRTTIAALLGAEVRIPQSYDSLLTVAV